MIHADFDYFSSETPLKKTQTHVSDMFFYSSSHRSIYNATFNIISQFKIISDKVL